MPIVSLENHRAPGRRHHPTIRRRTASKSRCRGIPRRPSTRSKPTTSGPFAGHKWPRLLLRRRHHELAEMSNWQVRTTSGPTIAVAPLEAVAVEEAGNQIVAGDQHQLTHGLDNISRSAVALSAPVPRQAQPAVSATHPVDDENDFRRRVVDIGQGVMDEGAYNAYSHEASL
jgi:hypothetical protein